MANRFQIRSGSSIPSPLDLLDKELGYNVKNKKLYINNNGSIQEVTINIVNNLTTNNSNKALSAKQGKLLNEVKLDGSAYTATDVLAKLRTVDGEGSGLDADTLAGYHWNDFSLDVYRGDADHLDTFLTSGTYGILGRAEAPAGNIGVLHVLAYSPDWIVQRWYPIGGENSGAYQRMRHSGTTWTPWARDWNSENDGPGSGLDADLLDGQHASALILAAYPVGSIYLSVVSTNPGTLFGGTWARFGNGRVLVGINESDTDFNTAQKTGGAKTHTLTTDQIPSHTHNQVVTIASDTGTFSSNTDCGDYASKARSVAQGAATRATGGGGAHNNLQPYITCYMWVRTA